MISIPLAPILAWLMVFLRVGLILALFPLLGDAFVPVRVRIILAGVVSLALAPVSHVSGGMFPATGGGVVAMVAQEGILAFGVALIGHMMFGIIQYSGQLAGEQMGFGMINAIDPTGSHQVSVVAELQYVLAILLFFATGLHQPVFRLIAWSFSAVPPGGGTLTLRASTMMVDLAGTMFGLALGFAMPVIAIVFSINIGLAMVARAVPQINIFMESFPLRIVAGLSVTMLGLGAMTSLWTNMFEEMERAMARFVAMLGS